MILCDIIDMCAMTRKAAIALNFVQDAHISCK